MPRATGAVARVVRRQASRRGLLGGDRTWFAVWVVLTMLRVLRRFTGRDPEVVYREELKPGEGLLITAGSARTDSTP